MGMGFGTGVFPEASLMTQTVTVDADDRQLVYGARRMRLCASTVVVATNVPPYGCTIVQNGHGRILMLMCLPLACSPLMVASLKFTQAKRGAEEKSSE